MLMPKFVLIVDDEAEIRRLIAIALEAPDRIVRTAANGLEAMQLMREQPPDGLLTDMMMPVMDGRQFVRACQAHATFRRIPILVISADPKACEDGMRLGAAACLSKPFDLDELAATVEKLLDGAQGAA